MARSSTATITEAKKTPGWPFSRASLPDWERPLRQAPTGAGDQSAGLGHLDRCLDQWPGDVVGRLLPLRVGGVDRPLLCRWSAPRCGAESLLAWMMLRSKRT